MLMRNNKLNYEVTKMKNGLVKEYHDNGQLMYEENYVNGKREGFYRGWHDNGQLWFERNYVNGKLV